MPKIALLVKLTQMTFFMENLYSKEYILKLTFLVEIIKDKSTFFFTNNYIFGMISLFVLAFNLDFAVLQYSKC